MPIALYMDHHVPRVITVELRLRRVDVLTAYEDGTSRLDDSELLNRASELKRVLFTQDDDLLVEATKRQREGISFCGVIYAHQLRVSNCDYSGELFKTVYACDKILCQTSSFSCTVGLKHILR